MSDASLNEINGYLLKSMAIYPPPAVFGRAK